jgi:hypothetical protein
MNDALTRALTAIEASRDTPEYHKVVRGLVEAYHLPPTSVHALRNTILAIAAEAIRAEFAADDEWEVVEIKTGVFAIRSNKTGEFYTAATRGNGRRLVTFRFIERAKIIACLRNAR